jgi:2-polyprenyl-3-methyl-5-hydroxy-6-metoxy-1,4-benzoquinol methylase
MFFVWRLRIPFIRDRLAPTDLSDRPLAGFHILDVGCGAGIVSESLGKIFTVGIFNLIVLYRHM